MRIGNRILLIGRRAVGAARINLSIAPAVGATFRVEVPMKAKSVFHVLLVGAALFASLPALQQLQAAGNHCACSEKSVCCPQCRHCCKLEVSKEDEKKKCFECETKTICIPRIVFPWQNKKSQSCSSCAACGGKGCNVCRHNGAKLRCIKVLKSKSYECPQCKYKWTAVPTGCNHCQGANCTAK